MRRVISVFLPHWTLEAHIRRTASAPPVEPFVVAAMDVRPAIVVAVNRAARAGGVRVGMHLERARSLIAGLQVAVHQPMLDHAVLEKLTEWCLRFSPLVAPNPPDGVWIDATGVAHLFGGETPMLEKIARRLKRQRLTARPAIAATPGAAWALARYGTPTSALRDLPLAALRLTRDTVQGFRRLGVVSIGDLMALPRATIPLRFGGDVLLRLDQALGKTGETITPILPPQARRRHLAFAEPIATREALEHTVALLTTRLCRDLELAGEGARRLDLLFHRIDKHIEIVRIGTARPHRDVRHLSKLLCGKLDTVDPGLGVEEATLTAWAVEPLAPAQVEMNGGQAASSQDLAELVDNLANRLGARNVYKVAPLESDIPERAVRPTPPMAAVNAAWPAHLPRPVRLFAPPEPVDVTAMLPDHPPMVFRWRGEARKVRRVDGPERVFGEWWVDAAETTMLRDYFRVEDEHGGRYWLFRDGRQSGGDGTRWYIHGLFGA